MNKLVHCKKEEYDVYIGRGSKWGNPYTHIKDKETKAQFIVETSEEAIACYKSYILKNVDLLLSLHELKDKTLSCWCFPKPCHGDVLIELINDFKVIVAGGRDFNDYELLESKLDKILANVTGGITIVCGLARGADDLGKKYGEKRGYNIAQFPYISTLGKRGGFVRNEQMAKYADAAVIFWDQISKGSKSMIDLSKKFKLKLRVINY